MLRHILDGVQAGLLIGIGGCVFLACENRYVGAVLFCVALLCICAKGYALYTGKVGYLAETHTKKDITVVLTALLGNVLATTVMGCLVMAALPQLSETAFAICTAKLTQTLPQALLRGIFCGMLMYLAVNIYRDKKTAAGIFFCVPTFILAGFEHSVADMFYFAVSGIVSLEGCIYLGVIVLGNALGGMLLPALSLPGRGTA